MGLGNTFCFTPAFTTGNIEENILRMARDFALKVFFAGDGGPDSDNSTKLYVKSEWRPRSTDIPAWVMKRLSRFFARLRERFRRRRAISNLYPLQEQLLEQLSSDPILLFPDTDKGLGPCAVFFDQYVEDGLVHLKNEKVYERLTEQAAYDAIEQLRTEIEEWLVKYKQCIPLKARQFIRHHIRENQDNPFGQFYIMYKIHKGIRANGTWPTRPVCSDVTSVPHGLGKWVTETLQPIAQSMPTYFKDSFVLKAMLDVLHIPQNGQFFTADADSMYTNIDTEPALEVFSTKLREWAGVKFHHYNPDCLINALEIVFRNNIFKFGDIFIRQTSGTGMGISPAPPWATIFYGVYEEQLITKWSERLMFFKRFIDDILGIWLCHPDPVENNRQWKLFQVDLDKWHGLTWGCTELSSTCNFMDLTLTIKSDKIITTVYEKEMNLHLYLPPHSAHAKGVSNSLVSGQVLRYRRLCTFQADADKKVSEFIQRLLARGHPEDSIRRLLAKAEASAADYLSCSNETRSALKSIKDMESGKKVRLHLTFHPEDPPSKDIQHLWRELVSYPAGEAPLPEMKNIDGEQVNFDKLVVAYKRPPNLRNRFSVRDISGRGRAVSTYWAT
jgi:hypothetical protein